MNDKNIDDNLDDYLWISVVFLSIFMRCNFVGPFEVTNYEINEWDKYFKYELFGKDTELTLIKCHGWLRMDNEDMEFELKYPFLLILSYIILKNGLLYLNHHQIDNDDNEKDRNYLNKISWHWWYFRALRYHQDLLSNRCPTIQNEILSQCQIIDTLFNETENPCFKQLDEINNEEINISLKQLLHCQFNIEYAIIADYYWKHKIVTTNKFSKTDIIQWI